MLKRPVDLPCPLPDWEPRGSCSLAPGTTRPVMDGDAGQAASGQWAPPGPGPSHCFLCATGPVLQPLERLKEQGTAGPWLLALAGSKRGSGTGGSEEQRPAEDQCDEARACLHTAPEPHQAMDMASLCPAYPQPSFPPSLLLCPKAFVSALWFPRASSALPTLLPLSVTSASFLCAH